MKALNIVNAGFFVACFWLALAVCFGWWDASVTFGAAYIAALAAAAVIFGWSSVAFSFALLPLLTAEAKNQNPEVTAHFRDTFMFPGMSAFWIAIAFGAHYRATVLQTTPLLITLSLLTIAAFALITAAMIVDNWLAKPEPAAEPGATTP